MRSPLDAEHAGDDLGVPKPTLGGRLNGNLTIGTKGFTPIFAFTDNRQ